MASGNVDVTWQRWMCAVKKKIELKRIEQEETYRWAPMEEKIKESDLRWVGALSFTLKKSATKKELIYEG